MEAKVYIPKNDVITETGYYVVTSLLDKYSDNFEAMQFIHEMMEE